LLTQINDPTIVMTNRVEQVTNPGRYSAMANKETAGSTASKGGPPPFPMTWGHERTEAAMALQKAILESYEQASRNWLARVQTEVSLWSDLANKLSTTHSVPEAMESYAKCVSERMQMAAEDGRRLFEESQQMTQKIAKSLGNGWPTAST
jgi:Phasin protein